MNLIKIYFGCDASCLPRIDSIISCVLIMIAHNP